MRDYILCISAASAAVCTYLFGAPDMWLVALLVLVALDYTTGLFAAVILKEVSSKVGFVGILKKILFFVVVAVAHIVDGLMGLGGAARNVVIGFLVANEGISVLENCARCGLPLPDKLLELLVQLKEM